MYNKRNNYQQQSGRGRGGGKGGQQRGRRGGHDNNIQLLYGLVINCREVFGFLQPFLPIPGEEHLYYNDKDVFGEKVQEGDEVQFTLRSGPRGYVAANVKLVDGGTKVKRSGVRGVVEKECDQYKYLPGLISVTDSSSDSTTTQSVPYMPGDINKSSRRLMKGDEVELDLYVIPDKGYTRAHSVKLTRTRKDRLIAEQVKDLESRGVAREQGVIETIKNDFGFIRPMNQPEQMFFRLEDVLDSSEHLPNEGDEVDFFVIQENMKGSMYDRAVHVKYLPHGTVQFEETLGVSLRAVVSVEPRVHPREEPGQLHLFETVSDPDSSAESPTQIETVELWSRCLPDGLTQMKCGDELVIDVTKYKPEKLIFARNVKISEYRALGRVHGVVCDIKHAGGYGFIQSSQGIPDSYFRLSDVLNHETGCLCSENDVKVGMKVSYDTTKETSRGGQSKLRAIRVQECPDDKFFPRKAVLQKNVNGTVVREARKGDRDGVGMIKLVEELADVRGVACHEVFVSHQDLFCALQDFRDNKYLREVTIGNCSPYQRYALHALLRHHFTGIAHETLDSAKSNLKSTSDGDGDVQILSLTEGNLNAVTNSVATASAAVTNSLRIDDYSPTKGKNKKSGGDDEKNRPEVRIWKIDDSKEFEDWLNANNDKYESYDQGSQDETDKTAVYFQKADLVDSLRGGIGVRNGSDVIFDVCIDRVTGKRVAANVRLSDLEVEGGEWPQVGILEYYRTANSNEHGGYIRCVPSNEKLMWNQLMGDQEEGQEESDDKNWITGRAVCFEIRLRGGVRYAAGVTLLNKDRYLTNSTFRLLMYLMVYC